MELQEIILRRNFPVVINSFNQPTYLKNITSKFKEFGFRNIYILDNASTNNELLKFYEELKSDLDFLTIFYNRNNGPRFFHLDDIYHILGGTPHLYSDPDIDFDFLPENFVTTLYNFSEKYSIAKVGCALSIPSDLELKENVFLRTENLEKKIHTIKEWESQFWLNSIEPDIYLAAIDTTLHLFNPKFFDKTQFFSGIRIAKSGFSVKHLPWFKSDIIPESELNLYKRLATQWSSYSRDD
jgi:hypothetical protein